MVQNSCWQSKSHKVKAFTLLESLLALLVISGGLLLFQAMSQLLISEVRYQQQSEQKEWILFVDQLEAELDRSQFEKVEGNRLYMKQDGKESPSVSQSQTIFVKPMLVDEVISLWFMASNPHRLQRTINWCAFVSSFKKA
ncbi:competence protein ComGF [Streptococcus pneumoniae]|nr:competence protein ComGF [Streptococcus pneumoniae]